ncbi:MAG: DUF262 domain-containing protein [Candidatus Micrarchaeia archaeon]
MFSPEEEYVVTPEKIQLRDIREYPDRYILRPPYQRHSKVWDRQLKEQLLDSICRKYYIPKLVLRNVRLDDKRLRREVIDGQQRLTTVLEFFDNSSELRLPESLKDLDPELPGKKYNELDPEKREWVDKDLHLEADIITDLSSKTDPKHIKIASDLFWRLQQGEPLAFIETLHSKLNSNVRNFVSKYADTVSFDFDEYRSLDSNPSIHPFFKTIIGIDNLRMQYLLLLTRFLMIEFADGPTDVGDKKVKRFFDEYPVMTESDQEFEGRVEVKNCLSNLNSFQKIYDGNITIDQKEGVKYLKKDYYILSLYLLLRHLKKYYVFEQKEYQIFDSFSRIFYERLVKNDPDDYLITRFRENRQQSDENLQVRDMILRKIFFENNKLIAKDTKRSFDEAERIQIYVRDRGICILCYKENISQGLPEDKANEKARVPWNEYDSDHIKAHIKGGSTDLGNAQVLCRTHNAAKKDNVAL